jgi:hypothetical protein
MLFLIRLSFLGEGKYGFERTTLCVRACVSGVRRGRVHPLQDLNYTTKF